MDSSPGANTANPHDIEHPSHSVSSTLIPLGTELGTLPSPAFQPSNGHQRSEQRNPDCAAGESGSFEDLSFSSTDHSSRNDQYTATTPLLSTFEPSIAMTQVDDDGEYDDRMCLESESRLKEDFDTYRSTDFYPDPERSAGLMSRRPTASSSLKDTLINVYCRASRRAANVRGDYIPLQDAGGSSTSGSTLDDLGVRGQPSEHLRGYALGILGRTSPLRVWLYNLLIHRYAEPVVLALIIVNAVVLVVQASRPILLLPDQDPITVKGYFHTWEDFVIFVLFVTFTIEALGRICLTGLFLDPEVRILSLFSLSTLSNAFGNGNNPLSLSSYSRTPSFLSRRTATMSIRPGSLKRGSTWSSTLSSTMNSTMNNVFASVEKALSLPRSSHASPPSPATELADLPPPSPTSQDQSLRTTSSSQTTNSDGNKNMDAPVSLPFQLDLEIARSKIERNIPYLRQGWGRIDFIAIIGFWASFALATAGLERGTQHIGIFRALSVLRTARLLAVTDRTATIMRSLKFARPLLANVIYFVIFAMVLFAVIGVQSFKASLRRSCTLLPVLGADEVRLNQTCGGYINATTLTRSPYLFSDGTPAGITKGFICPLGQVCKEGENPYNGLESFDTVYYAALQIVVLASASSWPSVMYQIMASEYDVTAAFFIFGVLVLNFWLFNLLVAVITNSFSAIRSGTDRSAFGPESMELSVEGGWFVVTGHPDGSTRFKLWWSYTKWFWVTLALVSLVVQATTNTDVTSQHQKIIDVTEFAITLAFDVEILVRVALEFPDWRQFFLHFHNWLDLIIAIACSLIQIPAIHNSKAYPWLTVFQLARFFRVLLAIPRIQRLMLTVFGNLNGLANMVLFLILITFLAALFAVQIIQGDMPGTIALNFGQLFNSFLAAYQILSKDSWTTLLYNTAIAEQSRGQPITVIAFLCCWLFFSSFIVMQMFIAVINENFDVAAEEKRKNSTGSQLPTAKSKWNEWFSNLNLYVWLYKMLWGESSSPTSGTFTQESASPNYYQLAQVRRRSTCSSSKSLRLRWSPFRLLHAFFTEERNDDDLHRDLYLALFEPGARKEPTEYATDKYFNMLAPLTSMPLDSEDIRIIKTKELIQKYPTYDRTLWIFAQGNPLRSLCQMIVRPSGGERINGTQPSGVADMSFRLVIFLAVSGHIVTAAIATPLYRHQYYVEHDATRAAWFHITDAAFGLILVVEFLIKIIADGILLTPNAYVRSIWNIFDFIIMVCVLVNVSFTLVLVVGLSRFTRSLKALQALRLMTLIDKMRNTFEDLLLANFIRVLDAAALAVLYLIPFSVWATNIFAGLMNQCNDLGATGIRDCTNEYINKVDGSSFGFLVPRVWNIPSPSTTFCFDNFHSSFLILFEIVSQTGWVNVMSVAMSITGKGLQPRTNASQANAIFFVVYNLLGAVVVLTLFVSIIIRNSPSRTGAPYLTKKQREWGDLLKLIKRLKPSKIPKDPPTSDFRLWCYERATHKRVWWPRMMTLLFAVQMGVLMTQAFSAKTAGDWHNIVTLVITFIYVVDVIIQLYGLGWRFFLTKRWNIFDVIVASGSFITTILAHFYPKSFAVQLLQKLFLVSMSFKLVHKVSVLNHLFKSGVASLPEILNLLALWFTLFLFFAIMYMEVFGLTKWYSAENSYQNYQTMGSTLLMLVSLSTGGGWNQFMHDHALEYPQCTQTSDSVYRTDCGSQRWAYALFIAWNLLSMYLFASMFIGVIVRSFAYVFQSSHGVLEFMTRRGERGFKDAWGQIVSTDADLLERKDLPRFLAKLDGALEVRIYPSRHSISSIRNAYLDGMDNDTARARRLNQEIEEINVEEIQKRRAVYTRIYHEANLMCCRPDKKGISFTEMLELLAHYKLIKDDEALTPKEFKSRKAIRDLITDLVKLDKAASHLQMKILHRRYLQRRSGAGQGIGTPSSDNDAAKGLLETVVLEPPSDNSYGEGWHSKHDVTRITSSPRTLVLVASPELSAREEKGCKGDLHDDAYTLPSTTRQPDEETKLLQAEENHA